MARGSPNEVANSRSTAPIATPMRPRVTRPVARNWSATSIVAGVDGHIGLDEWQELTGFALARTDNAGGNGALEPEGGADGHHPLAHAQARHVADAHRGQAGGLDFDHRDVGAPIGPHHPGRELAPVGERDDDLVGSFDHVRVGHDEAVGTQDEARTHATRPLDPRPALRALRATRSDTRRHRDAKAAEKLFHQIVRRRRASALAHALDGADIDHRRPDLIDQHREVGQAAHLHRGADWDAACRCGLRQRVRADGTGGERARLRLDRLRLRQPKHANQSQCGRAGGEVAPGRLLNRGHGAGTPGGDKQMCAVYIGPQQDLFKP